MFGAFGRMPTWRSLPLLACFVTLPVSCAERETAGKERERSKRTRKQRRTWLVSVPSLSRIMPGLIPPGYLQVVREVEAERERDRETEREMVRDEEEVVGEKGGVCWTRGG